MLPGPTPSNDGSQAGHMAVLLDAIEHNPAPNQSLQPYFFAADAAVSELQAGTSNNINSLLEAASHQSRSPARDPSLPSSRRQSLNQQTPWLPHSSALASFHNSPAVGMNPPFSDSPDIAPLFHQPSSFGAPSASLSSAFTPQPPAFPLPQLPQLPQLDRTPAFAQSESSAISHVSPPPSIPSESAQPVASPADSRLGKRKYGGFTTTSRENEKRQRIKRSIERVSMPHDANPEASSPLTTVLCLHPSAAQKSYGKEKRLLAPPPMVQVLGPLARLAPLYTLEMAVMSESGQCLMTETADLQQDSKAYFRGLHLRNTSKAKVFNLRLSFSSREQVSAPSTTTNGDGPSSQAAPITRTFASLDSEPTAIIAKPSKKTAKARNTTSCMFAGSSIALYNRINSQTVRTKYMTVDEGNLVARTSQWSAFTIHVVRRAEDVNPNITDTLATSDVPDGANTVTYGSTITLTDLMTGTKSEEFIVRKVEQREVVLDATGPVSQLQKMALARVLPDGRTIYLSAASDGLGVDGKTASRSDDGPGHSTKSEDDSDSASKPRYKKGDQLEDDGLTVKTTLTYEEAKSASDSSTLKGVTGPIHGVTDFMCWTVLGVTSFSYSFLDSFGTLSDGLPSHDLTPFPAPTSPPVYAADTHTVSLPVSNYLSIDSKTGEQTGLDVYLGSIGPLDVEVSSDSPASPNPDPDSKSSTPCAIFKIQLPPVEAMLTATYQPKVKPLAPPNVTIDQQRAYDNLAATSMASSSGDSSVAGMPHQVFEPAAQEPPSSLSSLSFAPNPFPATTSSSSSSSLSSGFLAQALNPSPGVPSSMPEAGMMALQHPDHLHPSATSTSLSPSSSTPLWNGPSPNSASRPPQTPTAYTQSQPAPPTSDLPPQLQLPAFKFGGPDDGQLPRALPPMAMPVSTMPMSSMSTHLGMLAPHELHMNSSSSSMSPSSASNSNLPPPPYVPPLPVLPSRARQLTLPLVLVRSTTGVGYMTGRSVVVSWQEQSQGEPEGSVEGGWKVRIV